jgi:DNA-binding MarR family transcriptional regulator
MTADIQSVLIDVALWLYRTFFAPGDQLLSKFPALDVPGYSRVVSGLLSAVVWLGATLLIVYVLRLLRDLDRALTAFVVRLCEELQRAWRVVARRVTIALRSYALERQARLARTEVSELPALSGLQLQILQSHASLPPAHLLTPSDIARALHMRSTDVEKVLGTLRKLSLLERTLGAGDGEDGYRLTRAGQVFLAACRQPKRIEPTLGSA